MIEGFGIESIDLCFLFIDMPPGHGDIPLTVYQMILIDKVITVTSPQSLVSLIVEKSINKIMRYTWNIREYDLCRMSKR